MVCTLIKWYPASLELLNHGTSAAKARGKKLPKMMVKKRKILLNGISITLKRLMINSRNRKRPENASVSPVYARSLDKRLQFTTLI